MRIVFGALHFTYFRNFESVVCALAERGHDVYLFADEEESLGGRQLVERLAARYPNVAWGFAPALDAWRWTPLARRVRRALEYVRFRDPRYDATPKYRYRSEERAPRLVRWVLNTPGLNVSATRHALASMLSWVERQIPTNPELDAFLAARRPDVVLLASVTNPGSLQLDHLKSAMRLGVRTGVTVWSWDHLSGKAWLRLVPDRIFVWNDVQRAEARDMHGLPEDRVVITGAQVYDQWFDRQPSRERTAFCRELGLDPSRPILLYVCSVLVRPAPSEAEFVLEWVRRIRASADPALRSANIVIRPHPERLREWEDADLSAFERVVVRGRNPIDAAAKADYYDSLHHSAAVVGLVTSAFLEAAVVGRPVLTVQRPEFRMHQEGTPHFQYLVGLEGGLLETAPTFDAHLEQLAAVLRDPSAAATRTARFIERFIRPQGLARPATPVFADAVEQLGAAPAPGAVRFAAPAGVPVVVAVDLLTRVPLLRLALMSRRDSEDEAASRARAQRDDAVKQRVRAATQARVDAKERAKAESLARKHSARALKEQQKTARLKERARTQGHARRARLKGFVKQLIGLGH